MDMSGSGAVPPGEDHRRRSFGSDADATERSRPGYPPEAVRWLLENPEEPLTVVDLAAGTGMLTRVLAADGHDVLSIESNRQLLTKLTRRIRVATGIRGVAEAIPLRDGTVDALVAGEAFQWFDVDRALSEMARVLRPGGTMGLIWNRRDESVPWVRQLSGILGGPNEWDERSSDDLMELLEFDRRFEAADHDRFRLWQRLDKEGLVQMVSTRPSVSAMATEDRQDLLDRVRMMYNMTANQPEGLTLPYTTLCYRARRV